jgi:hypothetical protein
MEDSITRSIRPTIESDPTTEHSTTKNEIAPHSCYLCWRHAEHEYHTKAFFLAGAYYPSETRHLCTMHYRRVWGVMLRTLGNRVRVEQEVAQSEYGAEEDDSDYEPYYSRADEMADQANADYYDEIARRGGA